MCSEDYFDLASLDSQYQTTASIYDDMSPELRPIAWAITAKRIGYGDPAAAKAWVEEHATDPGCHYDGISDLFDTLSHEDPEETVKWAVRLPFSESTYGNHPALRPFPQWRQRDPEAVAAWLKTQPATAPWRPIFEY